MGGCLLTLGKGCFGVGFERSATKENARAIGAANPLWGGAHIDVIIRIELFKPISRTHSEQGSHSTRSSSRYSFPALHARRSFCFLIFRLFFSFLGNRQEFFFFCLFFGPHHQHSAHIFSYVLGCCCCCYALASALRSFISVLEFFLSFPFCVSSRLAIILFLLLPPFVPSRLVCIYQKLVYSSSVSLCSFPASNKIANKSSTPFDAQQNTHTLFFSLAF